MKLANYEKKKLIKNQFLLFRFRMLSNDTSYKWLPNDDANQFLSCSLPELSQFPDSIKSYESLYEYSIENNESFWSILANSRLQWMKPFTQVTSGSSFDDKDFNLKWFTGAKLNVSGMRQFLISNVLIKIIYNLFVVNCVDRHYLKNPQKIALIWDKDEPGTEERVTYE